MNVAAKKRKTKRERWVMWDVSVAGDVSAPLMHWGSYVTKADAVRDVRLNLARDVRARVVKVTREVVLEVKP